MIHSPGEGGFREPKKKIPTPAGVAWYALACAAGGILLCASILYRFATQGAILYGGHSLRMLPLTALLGMLSGSVLLTQGRARLHAASPAERMLAQLQAQVLLILVAVRIGGQLLGADWISWLDSLGRPFSGGMSPLVFTAFLIIGMSLRFQKVLRSPTLGQSALVLVSLVAWTSLACLPLGASPFPSALEIPGSTALLLLLLSTGLLALQGDRGIMALMAQHDSAGSSLRRSLPAALIVPFVGMTLAFLAQREGVLNLAQSYALVSFVCMIGLAALLWRNAARQHAAEQRVRSLIENASDAIITKDLSSIVISWNPAAERIFGFTEREMIGQSMRRLIPTERLQEEDAILSKVRQGELVEHFETERLHKAGHQVPVSVTVSPIRDASGRVIGASHVARDTTFQRQTRRRIQESESRFSFLADSLQQLIWTADAQGQCDYVNQQWTQFTGVDSARLLQEGWLGFVHPQDQADLVVAWRAAIADLREFSHEFRLRRHDGVYRWMLARGRVQPATEAGGAHRWCGVTADIEDLKRGQSAQLRTQKMEALGTLAGGIAHDFNNILLAITGNTQLALEDLAPEHPARSSLSEIERASRRAAELVRRILAFSRKEEPKTEVQFLQPLVEEALKLLRPTLPAQIQLQTEYGLGVEAIRGDAGQIHQILMNLITNAAHAIGNHGGCIRIQVERLAVDDEHSTKGLTSGQYVCLTITDDGCGMSRETQQRIFDPFFTTKPSGTGLGLSVVDGIMKSHQGAVTVYSEPGKGSCFRLYFPASAQLPASHLRSRESVGGVAPAAGQRILYVDDDPALVKLTTRKLTRLGYSVSGETDPVAALEHFRENPRAFDAVITDLSMPQMPGFELARQLLLLRADLPIIATSGFVRPEDQELAVQIGIRALILKPSALDELARVLEGVFKEDSRSSLKSPRLKLV